MDIRKFFSTTNVTTKKPSSQNFTNLAKKPDSKNVSKLSKKRRIAVIESDSDEEPLPSKKTSPAKKSPKSKPNLAALQKFKAEKKTLKPVLSKDFFNSSNHKSENIVCVDIDDDDDFDKTLNQLDNKNVTKLSNIVLIEDTSSSCSPNITIDDNSDSSLKTTAKRKKLDTVLNECIMYKPSVTKKNNLESWKGKEIVIEDEKPKQVFKEKEMEKTKKEFIEKEIEQSKKEVKEKEIEKPKKGLKNLINTDDLENVDSKAVMQNKERKDDQEMVGKKQTSSKEKMKMEAIKTPTRNAEELSYHQEEDRSDVTPKEKLFKNSLNYRNYLHRQGPQALGTKEIPEGDENCLQGLTFLVTGVLESLEREEVKDLTIKYGGKMMSTLSKNTTYLIVGRDAGEVKLDKAEKLGTKFLNEDEFLNLIRIRPGPKGKNKGTKLEKPLRMQPIVNKSITLETLAVLNVPSKATSSSPSNDSPTSYNAFVPESSLMWVDKYKPVSLQQVIGQQGDRSCAKKLLNWLKNWQKNQSGEKKPPRGKWNGKEDGSIFKAALLSGPPGVGKTTTATLACKEAGYEFIELNASDTRSKKCLQSEISEVLQNQTISGSINKEKLVQKHAIIFDEVDGMSGNEDRGGTQELISLIKHSKIPVVCICNDRTHPKIRSLANYCLDLRFVRPRVEQIKAGMMSLLHKEKVKVLPETLHEIITATNQDLRQVLHHLSFFTSKSITEGKELKAATKDIKLSPFDVLKKVFSMEEAKSSMNDKSSLFFHDYSLAPLFVYENYPAVKPASARGNINKHLELLSEAADSISFGDIIDRTILSQNNWSLLPTQAMFSSVFPGEMMRGYLSQMIAFPSWLGKNSSKNHMDRVLQQIHMHTRLRTSANKSELGVEYLPQLRCKLTQPLIDHGTEGVKEVLETMEGYYLLREDLDSVVELTLWPPQKDPMSLVEPKVKAALTRSFNKECFKNPYATINIKKGKKRSAETSFDEDLEDGEDEVESEDEDVAVDSMVKQKKSAKVSKEIDVASSSKGKGRGKSTRRGRK